MPPHITIHLMEMAPLSLGYMLYISLTPYYSIIITVTLPCYVTALQHCSASYKSSTILCLISLKPTSYWHIIIIKNTLLDDHTLLSCCQ